jgi:2-polyprenyl-6-methoxyphenol hydroxylase-like FAD-dependent oxidoreductase
MVIYPIRDLPNGRQLVNWVAEKQTEAGRPMPRQDWSAAVDRSEVLDHFGSFTFDWLDVPELIRGAEQVLAYPMVDREPLTTWRPPPGAPGHGRMTLLGDAAHPMYPVGSNGGSQAIIDARVLARELALAEPGTGLSVALDRYEAARLPATAAIVRANRQAGPERCMEIVAERAPRGFARVADVISDDELQEIVVSYRRTAGFDPEVLNTRPSLGVGRT